MPIDNYFDVPFAQSGTLTPIPDAVQPDGSVSYTQGFGVDYTLPNTNPNYKAIDQGSFNQLMNDITNAIQQYQQNGIPPFITSAMNNGTPYSYNQYAMVLHSGVAYQSNTNSNTDTPPSSKWNVASIGTGNVFTGGTTTGSANAQTLSSVSPTQSGFSNGQAIICTAGYTNTGSATFQAPGESAITIQKDTGSGLTNLTGGEIVTGNTVIFVKNTGSSVWVLQAGLPLAALAYLGLASPGGLLYSSGGNLNSYVPNNITGLLPTSITGSSTTAAINISAGQASNTTGVTQLVGASGFSWGVGLGNAANGYQGGTTLPNSSTLHFFICGGTSGTCSFASTSTTPTAPSGYNSWYRRIFSLNTDGSGNPIGYTADEIMGGAAVNYLASPSTDISGLSLNSTSRTALTFSSVPTGVKFSPLFDVSSNVGGASGQEVLITSSDEPDSSVTGTNCNVFNQGSGNTAAAGGKMFLTNTSAQLFARASGSITITSVTRGWIDHRRT